MISGFRVAFGGAAEYYGIKPDIVTYGKIIGGGLPVGAYGASDEIMACISPLGDVYQAGTLSGNPVAMSAGIAQISACLTPNFYEDQQKRTEYFTGMINAYAKENNYLFEMVSIGSIFWMTFGKHDAIRAASQINPASMGDFKNLYANLLNSGIYVGPSGYEVGFVSAAHTEPVLKEAAGKFCKALDDTFKVA